MDDATFCVNSPMLVHRRQKNTKQSCEQSQIFLKDNVNKASTFLLQKELLLMEYSQWEQSNALGLCSQSPQGLSHRGIKTLNDKRIECLDDQSGINPEPVQVHIIKYAELFGQQGKHR